MGHFCARIQGTNSNTMVLKVVLFIALLGVAYALPAPEANAPHVSTVKRSPRPEPALGNVFRPLVGGIAALFGRRPKVIHHRPVHHHKHVVHKPAPAVYKPAPSTKWVPIPSKPVYHKPAPPAYKPAPAPEPVYEPAPEPVYEPAPAPAHEPAPVPAYEPAPEIKPFPSPVYDIVVEEPAPEPVYEIVVEE